MRIVADENLKDIESIFSRYGKIELLPGREITKNRLGNAEVLLVRSVTAVNESLLHGSNVRFVGSATSGTEHIDKHYLAQNNIKFCDAKGANARAVAEYCIAALCFAEQQGRFNFLSESGSTVGIVGLGCVGGELARLLLKLEVKVAAYDPLIDRATRENFCHEGVAFVPLENIFEMNAVTLHVPLTENDYATKGMVGADLIGRMPQGGVFINASRGGVVKEDALLAAFDKNPKMYAVLDVWDSEPKVNKELVQKSAIATPHFAGYSERAKKQASLLLEKSFIEYNTQLESGSDSNLMTNRGGGEEPTLHELETAVFDSEDGGDEDNWTSIVREIFPLSELSDEFKNSVLNESDKEAALSFDVMRKAMINRDEFSATTLNAASLPARDLSILTQLGFMLSN